MSSRGAFKTARYKRPFDLIVLVLVHLLLLPMWLFLWTLIPLMIWLWDRGPVFFRQKRAGKNGQVFTISKFRTMSHDFPEPTAIWTVDGDKRITPIGKILRRTAMDEIPCLLSVWTGHMSLVGPRPLDVLEQRMLEKQIPGFECRLGVKPGLTGLAQVYDKMDVAKDKLRYDLEYIDKMSVWLDLRLLIRSVLNTLTAKWDQREGKGTLS